MSIPQLKNTCLKHLEWYACEILGQYIFIKTFVVNIDEELCKDII